MQTSATSSVRELPQQDIVELPAAPKYRQLWRSYGVKFIEDPNDEIFLARALLPKGSVDDNDGVFLARARLPKGWTATKPEKKEGVKVFFLCEGPIKRLEIRVINTYSQSKTEVIQLNAKL